MSELEAALAWTPATENKKPLAHDPPPPSEKDRGPSETPSIELPITPVLQWGVPNAQVALENHAIGNFRQSAALAEALSQDPKINAPLSTRTKAITALKIEWEPAAGEGIDPNEARRIADIAAAEWPSWVPEQESERLHRWFLLMGCALGQIVWDRRTTPWKPRFNAWHLANLYWYWDGVQKFGKWQIICKDGVKQPVGGDGQWVFAKATEKEPWMMGHIRSLTVPFLMRLNAYVAWARLNEKYGLAFLVNEVPMATPDKYVQEAADALNCLGSESVITIRQGDDKDNQWKLDFRQVNPQAFLTFLKSLELWADDIATDLLGQSATQHSGKYGSRADTEVKNEIRLSLLRADAMALSAVWNEQLLPQWAWTNFGNARYAPRMRYVTDSPEPISKTAGAASQLITAFAQMFKAQGPNAQMPQVDFVKLFNELGIPTIPAGAPVAPETVEVAESKPIDPQEQA